MAINVSTSGAIFRWRPACWLRVTGDDSATFLQGQFSNDLRELERGAVYGLWLTVKGKVLADSFVLRGRQPGEFWIGSYASSAAVIRQRLESFIIADDVLVEDQTVLWEGVSVFGLDPAILDGIGAAERFVFAGRRGLTPNLECVFRTGSGLPAGLAEAAGVELTEDDIVRRRIAAGIPAIPTDLGPGDLPNEAGLDVHAISYTKGCYLGQEVMARLKAMGQTRRRLWRVRGDGDLPSVPAAVFAADRQVGELRSAVPDDGIGWIGLAMLSLLHVKPADRLSFAANGQPVIEVNAAP